jgi:Holliday junction resolvasome RuvABC endonuclease subunit
VSRGYAWGIDCGSLRVGLGLVDMDTGEIHSRAAAWRTGPQAPAASMVACHALTGSFFRIAAERFSPATIAFEMPTGKHRNPSLVMHTGVIVLAAAQATGLHPWKAGVTEWKKVVQGSGNAARTVGGLDLGLLHGAEGAKAA